MNNLIIFSHPNHESLNGHLLENVISGLKANNDNQIQVIDLYKEGFNPSLYFDKVQRRRDLYLVEEVKDYQEKITWADRLIFVYPIWWGRGPAMLMGFIDRLFTTHFAYKQRPNKMLPKGLFEGKTADVIVTLEGPQWGNRIYSKDSHRQIMKNQVLKYCGIKKVRFLEVGYAENITTDQLNKQILKIKKLYA